jgi:hypothetical protein
MRPRSIKAAPARRRAEAQHYCSRVLFVHVFVVIKLKYDLENFAFLISAQDEKHNGSIKCGNVFVTMLSWQGYYEGLNDATLAILVRMAKTTKMLQIRIAPKEKVLEEFGREVAKMLLKALLPV